MIGSASAATSSRLELPISPENESKPCEAGRTGLRDSDIFTDGGIQAARNKADDAKGQ